MAKRQNKLNREKRFTPHWVVDDLFAVSDKVFCHCFLQGIDRNCHITTCELTGSTNQHICSSDCKLGSDLLMTDSFQRIGMGTEEQRPAKQKGNRRDCMTPIGEPSHLISGKVKRKKPTGYCQEKKYTWWRLWCVLEVDRRKEKKCARSVWRLQKPRGNIETRKGRSSSWSYEIVIMRDFPASPWMRIPGACPMSLLQH